MKTFLILLFSSSLIFSRTTTYVEQKAKDQVSQDTLKKDGIDPVCKMKVKAGNTKTAMFNKTLYGFCSESCRKSFAKEPKKYIK